MGKLRSLIQEVKTKVRLLGGMQHNGPMAEARHVFTRRLAEMGDRAPLAARVDAFIEAHLGEELADERQRTKLTKNIAQTLRQVEAMHQQHAASRAEMREMHALVRRLAARVGALEPDETAGGAAGAAAPMAADGAGAVLETAPGARKSAAAVALPAPRLSSQQPGKLPLQRVEQAPSALI